MSRIEEFYTQGTDARRAWTEGRATCPECRRLGCRGQCGCLCRACKETPVETFTLDQCDHNRESQRRAELRRTPQGIEQMRREYRESLSGRAESRVSWGECIAQVERMGCPHNTAAAARSPAPWPAVDAIKRWWSVERGAKPVLLLSGGTGTGKSVAAAHVAAKFAEGRKWWVSAATGATRTPLVWMRADEIGSQALLSERDREFIERAELAEMLVLDELSVRGFKAGLEAVARVLTKRIDSGRLTVITTNAGGESLREPLGAHVVDRLKSARIVKLDEKSRRVA